MERAYGWVYDTCDGNELIINVVAGNLILTTFYYLFNSIFILIDAFDASWTRRFKVQQDKKVAVNGTKVVQPSFSKYVESIKLILFNQMVVATVTIAAFHYPMKLTGMSFEKKLPPALTVLTQVLFCIIIEEIGFYYSHRLFHHPKIYKYIHKIHHEWTAPVSITSIYCHPIEHAMSNLAPVLLGEFSMSILHEASYMIRGRGGDWIFAQKRTSVNEFLG
ncbi:hypothetical protein Y032_0003g1306 [Ancylostoma ceylanicum]|uniref:Fatty acid hydroxylase domain-containing protein n=1 Tax=Ancylostoma ceylanicum TaxID=53326 RepID=A0A016VY14_9BILA|nr:hypothetical protein Y032_0003g1306 [Ancylostoma ceylanicum]